MIEFLYSRIATGGIFILVIAIVRALFKKVVPRWGFKVLEVIVMVYMILPVQFSTSYSIYNFASFDAAKESMNQSSSFYWITIFWVVGGIICFLILIRSYVDVRALVNRSIPLVNMNHKNAINENMYYSDEISSPLSSGIFRKKVIFPKRLVSLESKKFEFIMRHETIHNLFQDNIIKMVSVVFLSIYWFHPLVWLLIYILHIDIEIVCDEAVVKHFDINERYDYAMTIIQASSGRFGGIELWFASFSESKVEERVGRVMKRKRNVFTSLLSLVLICVLSSMFATSPSASIEGSNYTKDIENKVYNVQNLDIDEHGSQILEF